MSPEPRTTDNRLSVVRAVRHHSAVVVLFLLLGALAGWGYVDSSPTSYTSTARVLVNPSVGNPYAPTPSSVRQDEQTSLETEAQVAHSAEVLDAVAEQVPGLTTGQVERNVQVTVPPNTQILLISFSATDPVLARQVTDAVAGAYLDNRARRFEETNGERIDRVETQTLRVVDDLRAATAAAQVGTAADRSFQAELADALRNELVSLRAQRTALENSESPAGAVISPATSATRVGALNLVLMPVGGAAAGLAIGCLLAVLLERFRGTIRSVRDVEAAGLPVVAAVPPSSRRVRLLHRARDEDFDATVRRLRASVLGLDPRPEIITVASPGSGASDPRVAEAVAESFAKTGHRVVLVRTDGQPTAGGMGIEERGLAQALLEQLNVLDLLQPSVEPLLNLLPHGRFTEQSRELLVADRLRAVLSPLIEAGHLVVIQSPGIDTAEGDAIVAASDLVLVVVTLGRTRPGELDQVTRQARTRGPAIAGVVVDGSGSGRRTPPPSRLERDHPNNPDPGTPDDRGAGSAGLTSKRSGSHTHDPGPRMPR